jgi:hypothetical protein
MNLHLVKNLPYYHDVILGKTVLKANHLDMGKS